VFSFFVYLRYGYGQITSFHKAITDERMTMRRRNAMIMVAVVCLLLVVTLIFSRCCNNKIDVERAVVSAIHGDKLCLEHVYEDEEWDSVYILLPYQDPHQLGLQVSHSDLKGIESLSLADQYCTLIFAHKGWLVAYSPIKRSVVDFSDMKGKIFPRSHVFQMKSKGPHSTLFFKSKLARLALLPHRDNTALCS